MPRPEIISHHVRFPHVCPGQVVTALLLVVALGLVGCDGSSGISDDEMSDPSPAPPTTSDTVTVTVDNVDNSAWEVTSVRGASGIIGLSGENPKITLTVGVRYQFDNNGGGPHPLGLQNANDEYLLRQENDETGSLEQRENINFLGGANRIAFTFTQTLADSVETYNCTVHPAMEGEVIVADN